MSDSDLQVSQEEAHEYVAGPSDTQGDSSTLDFGTTSAAVPSTSTSPSLLDMAGALA